MQKKPMINLTVYGKSLLWWDPMVKQVTDFILYILEEKMFYTFPSVPTVGLDKFSWFCWITKCTIFLMVNICRFTTHVGALLCNLKPAPIHRRRERPKKKAVHSKLVGGNSYNSKGNLHMKLVLSDSKTNRSPHHPSKSLYKRL